MLSLLPPVLQTVDIMLLPMEGVPGFPRASIKPHDPRVDDLLRQLTSYTPHLKHFSVFGCFESSSMDRIEGLAQLQTFVLACSLYFTPTLDVALLKPLSRLLNLAELIIEDAEFDITLALPHLTVPVLEKIRVAMLAHTFALLLSSTSTPRLRVLRLEKSSCRDTRTVDEFVRVVCSQSRSQLRVLNIQLVLDGDRNEPTPALSIIQPLFQFRDLQEVRFSMTFWRLFYSDEDIHTIARAWPELRVLDVPGVHSLEVEGDAQLSANALAHVALSCPIVSLTLPSFDHRHRPDITAVEELRHCLRNFYIAGISWKSWSDTRVDAVAQILIDIFLQLCADLNIENPNWKRVMEKYSALRGRQ